MQKLETKHNNLKSISQWTQWVAHLQVHNYCSRNRPIKKFSPSSSVFGRTTRTQCNHLYSTPRTYVHCKTRRIQCNHFYSTPCTCWHCGMSVYNLTTSIRLRVPYTYRKCRKSQIQCNHLYFTPCTAYLRTLRNETDTKYPLVFYTVHHTLNVHCILGQIKCNHLYSTPCTIYLRILQNEPDTM
jgi:hypothetical protein